MLVDEGSRDELIDGITTAWGNFFGNDPATSADFGRIVNERHHQRLTGLLDELGGEAITYGGERNEAEKYLAPTIVVDPPRDSSIMNDEIFGPILPILSMHDVTESIQFVNERPKPLALYVFSESGNTVDRVLSQTSSGGACVNHTLLQFVPPDLPFGGVGPSGMGRYHGKAGFEAFSNMKGVLSKPTKGENALAYPPYTNAKKALLRRVL